MKLQLRGISVAPLMDDDDGDGDAWTRRKHPAGAAVRASDLNGASGQCGREPEGEGQRLSFELPQRQRRGSASEKWGGKAEAGGGEGLSAKAVGQVEAAVASSLRGVALRLDALQVPRSSHAA